MSSNTSAQGGLALLHQRRNLQRPSPEPSIDLIYDGHQALLLKILALEQAATSR